MFVGFSLFTCITDQLREAKLRRHCRLLRRNGELFIMGGEGGAFVVKPKDDNLSGMFGEQEENYSDC